MDLNYKLLIGRPAPKHASTEIIQKEIYNSGSNFKADENTTQHCLFTLLHVHLESVIAHYIIMHMTFDLYELEETCFNRLWSEFSKVTE